MGTSLILIAINLAYYLNSVNKKKNLYYKLSNLVVLNRC